MDVINLYGLLNFIKIELFGYNWIEIINNSSSMENVIGIFSLFGDFVDLFVVLGIIIIFSILFIFIGVLGIVGNFLVIMVILIDRKMR